MCNAEAPAAEGCGFPFPGLRPLSGGVGRPDEWQEEGVRSPPGACGAPVPGGAHFAGRDLGHSRFLLLRFWGKLSREPLPPPPLLPLGAVGAPGPLTPPSAVRCGSALCRRQRGVPTQLHRAGLEGPQCTQSSLPAFQNGGN